MSTAAQIDPSLDARRHVVARLWDEAFNHGRVEVLPELVHDQYVNFGRRHNGPQFLADLIRRQRVAFPDMHFQTVQTFADGAWVITRTRWTGTFQAPFDFIGLEGIRPTGRAFDVEHAQAFRFVGEKIAEHWAIRDDLTMHRQLLGA